jgi:hypothetical protein
LASGIIPQLAYFAFGVGRHARSEARPGDAIIRPGIHAARDEGGRVLPGPDEFAGGGFPANVKNARGFEIGVVGSRR